MTSTSIRTMRDGAKVAPGLNPTSTINSSTGTGSFVDNAVDGDLSTAWNDLSIESPLGSDVEDDFATDQLEECSDASPAAPTGLIKDKSKWKTRMDNASYFAGGLVARPFMSTKKFTILRHSHGLVYYQGPLTSVAVTVFSVDPLPVDRTIWLQQKGWSGDAGMKIKQLTKLTSAWIDVTPAELLTSTQHLPEDDRAWQRDIGKFDKKKTKSKTLRTHICRETDVIRIPAGAQDGYFRLLLCANGTKKPLCASPVFRVASTSMSSGMFKGANLKTLPFELAVKIGSTMASNAGSNFLQPVTSVVQNKLAPFEPGFITKEVETMAYSASGAEGQVNKLNDQYEVALKAGIESVAGGASWDLQAVGDAEGPLPPYPIPFQARIARGEGRDRRETGAPSANLVGVEDQLKARLNGVYFGWITLTFAKTDSKRQDLFGGWKEVIVTVAPSKSNAASVVLKKDIDAYIIHDFASEELFDVKVNIILLGYLHQFLLFDPEESPMERMRDITITQLSLARPAWSVEAVLEKKKLDKKSRSFSERYVGARQTAQKHINRVPLHKLGVRTDGMSATDRVYGNGGYTILRQAI